MGLGTFFGINKGKKATKSLGGLPSSAENTPLTLPPSTFIISGTPVWRNLSELIYLLRCYYENPVVQAVVNIKAKAFSNVRFFVKDLNTEELTPLKKYDSDGGHLRSLIQRPNPLQSTFEWLRQLKVNFEVFGNGYCYGSVPIGFENNFDFRDITVLNNLPSYAVAPKLTGNWLEAETRQEIVEGYDLSMFNGKRKHLDTNKVFHVNNENIKHDRHFTEGVSDLIALQRPISNIDKAYESRNVLITKRGAIGAWTSEKKDEAMGNLPLNDEEVKEIQEAFKKYGLLKDQYSQIISPQPLKWQKTAMNVKELMLFEEIESDAIAVANAKGVPELLVKYYIKGGTFNNLDASEKRLYDTTIIPEWNDFQIALNHFLKTEEQGIELVGSFDHLKILQINKKEEAETAKIKQETALAAFRTGAITYNQYLAQIDMPPDELIGDLRVWDLSEEQQRAIGAIRHTYSERANIVDEILES
ncbi:hypothetical protein FGF1_03470 [Flavobacteriaceae bacterium GF1]